MIPSKPLGALVLALALALAPEARADGCSDLEVRSPQDALVNLACIAIRNGRLLPAVQSLREALRRIGGQGATSFTADRTTSRLALRGCVRLMAGLSFQQPYDDAWELEGPGGVHALAAAPTSATLTHQADDLAVSCTVDVLDSNGKVLRTEPRDLVIEDRVSGTTWSYDFATDAVQAL